MGCGRCGCVVRVSWPAGGGALVWCLIWCGVLLPIGSGRSQHDGASNIHTQGLVACWSHWGLLLHGLFRL